MDQDLLKRAIACVAQTPGVEIKRLAARLGINYRRHKTKKRKNPSCNQPVLDQFRRELEQAGFVVVQQQYDVNDKAIYIYPAGHQRKPLFVPSKRDFGVKVLRPGDPDYPELPAPKPSFAPVRHLNPSFAPDPQGRTNNRKLQTVLDAIAVAEEQAIARQELLPSKAAICRQAGISLNYFNRDIGPSVEAQAAYEAARDACRAQVEKSPTQEESKPMTDLAQLIAKHCAPDDDSPRPVTPKAALVVAAIQRAEQQAIAEGRGMPSKTAICEAAGVAPNWLAPSTNGNQEAIAAYTAACERVAQHLNSQVTAAPIPVVVELEERIHQLEQQNQRLQAALKQAANADPTPTVIAELDREIQADQSWLQEIATRKAAISTQVVQMESEIDRLNGEEAEILASHRRLVALRDRLSQSNVVNLRSA